LKKETVLAIVVALVVGVLGGIIVTKMGSKNQLNAPAGGGVSMGAGSPGDYQRRIAEAEKIVAQDPKNLQAWKQLGNDYFDTNQPQKAVQAYAKALELNPRDPDILTDQGIMYKNIGWYDKALQNFQKAQEIDPKHVQSLYNLGIVYAENLKQPENAIKAWNRIVEMDPTSPTATQVKGYIEQMKAQTGRK
jgi:tetratricopeptide (TPR) repeat protein